jgi:hypothetical protein
MDGDGSGMKEVSWGVASGASEEVKGSKMSSEVVVSWGVDGAGG